MTRTWAFAATLALVGAPALGTDGLEFHVATGPAFPQPGSFMTVSVYGHFPVNGVQVPWTFPPGTGQLGTMEGLLGATFTVTASAGEWSMLDIPAPLKQCGFGGCNTGQISGLSVLHISPSVGFNPPVAGPDLLLWQGRLTLPSTPIPGGQVLLDTLFEPIGNPQQRGIEVALSGIVPGVIVSQFVAGTDAHATIPVPAPPVLGLIGLGLGCLARRSRTLASCH